MITIIVGFIVSHIGVIGAALVAAGSVLFAWVKTKGAQTTVAQTKEQAQSKVDVANANAQGAIDNLNARKMADVQADAQAAKETTAAVQVAAQTKTDAQSMTSDQLDAEAAKLGILRKD